MNLWKWLTRYSIGKNDSIRRLPNAPLECRNCGHSEDEWDFVMVPRKDWEKLFHLVINHDDSGQKIPNIYEQMHKIQSENRV